MNVLRNLIYVSVLIFGFSMSVSAQKDDQDKNRPPKNPPVVNPGDKGRPPQRPPDNNDGNRPKKPETAWIKNSEETYILFV